MLLTTDVASYQTTSQWKERGIGDVCIKHNESTNRYRIVMRREQVLKVYCNAAIKNNQKAVFKNK